MRAPVSDTDDPAKSDFAWEESKLVESAPPLLGTSHSVKAGSSPRSSRLDGSGPTTHSPPGSLCAAYSLLAAPGMYQAHTQLAWNCFGSHLLYVNLLKCTFW